MLTGYRESEKTMTQTIDRTAGARLAAICHNRIEEEIIRAYVRLVCTLDQPNGLRTQIVARFGTLEIRMTEALLGEVPPQAPRFRIEIYSHESDAVLDSGDYFEFDEDELRAAVDLVVSAQVMQFHLH
ncbi:hypothetical protein [Microvirga arabica]|uniref:hypothetical protein n=1 Tax=Microvirga arabica TaxID=1128671 RepID=UPI00193930D3|nr:hypothetical protein [Microvirga arabica]MBM1172484.1 hypothetical protein [Microvirga arabica]